MTRIEEWFYAEDGREVGPRTAEEMRELIEVGAIRRDTPVWTGRMGDWTEAGRSDFAQHFGPPPLPRAPVQAPMQAPAQVTGSPPPASHPARAARGPAPARGFREAIRACFDKYVTFSGRASRSEYWYFVLFTLLATAAAALLDRLFGTMGDDGTGVLSGLLGLALLLPGLAVTSRRFHDAGWSFWWWLLTLVPVVGFVFVLYVAISRPEPGANRFDATT
jgi:uncharacterized membrane protein YhaH (DUF805 family)